MLKKVVAYLELIKFAHTIFALPFVLISLLLATNGEPSLEQLIWIILAMIGARSGAMGFNRLVDIPFDKENDRTKNRPSVNGVLNKSSIISFILVSFSLLIFSAYKLNSLAFYLSPVAIFLVCFYSLTKRFSSYSHLFLGLAIGSSPVACWIAIKGEITILPLLLGLSLLFWIAGFDIIYALMDRDFDKKTGLNSIPVRFGEKISLRLAFALHTLTVISWSFLPKVSSLDSIFWIGLILATILVFIEHWYASQKTIESTNLAFFNVNAFISVILLTFTTLDIYI